MMNKSKRYHFKTNQQDRNIGSNLILTGLLKISRLENLSFTRGFFNNKFLANLIKNSQYFLFWMLMKKIQMKWNICFTLPTFRFNKTAHPVFALAYWILYFYTLDNMLLHGLLQGKLDRRYLFNNMDTQARLNMQLKLCLTNK